VAAAAARAVGRFRVLAPDRPGHGSLAPQRWSVDASLDVLTNLIETAARGQAVVAGLSLGGYLGVLALYLESGLLRRGWLRPSREQAERKTMRLFPPELRDDAEEQRRAGVYPAALGALGRFLAAAPHARREVIEGAGHACSLERPHAFERAVRGVLSSAVGPPWWTPRADARPS
jgi:pimeloyl-ACP methyl ester carboxylesterase